MVAQKLGVHHLGARANLLRIPTADPGPAVVGWSGDPVRVLAVIPARVGSKRLPMKNFRQCAGKPLLAWSVEAALQAGIPPDDVVVSTDSHHFGRLMATIYGVQHLNRSPELATDEALTDPVLRETVHGVSGPMPDLVVLLQPTVPVRRPYLVRECIDRLQATGADSLLTAYPLHFVWWREDSYIDKMGGAYTMGAAKWRSQCPRRPRRQDMVARELMYHEDGSVYVCRSRLLLEEGKRLGGHVELFETERTVDIDTEEDFRAAEAMLAARAAERTVA